MTAYISILIGGRKIRRTIDRMSPYFDIGTLLPRYGFDDLHCTETDTHPLL
jgi:hypothetical protein